ncbi:hypothetical protein SAMN05428939_0127 [Streptomyces sp. TLI_105]|nr:hypothetical protein SAMN05428939_0127 [Streptomyces sp. TLI_105]
MNTTVAVPRTGAVLRALRPGNRAIVRVTDLGVGGLAVVDAAALNRPRTVPLSAVHPYEVLYRSRPPRSGYVPIPENDFVHRLLDAALCKAFGQGDPYAVVHVRAHPDWASGGVVRLAYEPEQIGEACAAGYGAEPAPQLVSGFEAALRFRRQARQHLCPVLEKPPPGPGGLGTVVLRPGARSHRAAPQHRDELLLGRRRRLRTLRPLGGPRARTLPGRLHTPERPSAHSEPPCHPRRVPHRLYPAVVPHPWT